MLMGLFGPSIGVKLSEPDRESLLSIDGAGPLGPPERPMGGYVSMPDNCAVGLQHEVVVIALDDIEPGQAPEPNAAVQVTAQKDRSQRLHVRVVVGVCAPREESADDGRDTTGDVTRVGQTDGLAGGPEGAASVDEDSWARTQPRQTVRWSYSPAAAAARLAAG